MTHRGTNTYLVGSTKIAVIDPGPDISEHLDAILMATIGQTITHILITHAHRDHSALAPRLHAATGAPILGYGPATSGRSPTMQALAAAGDIGGGEGLDADFAPDQRIGQSDVVELGPAHVVVHETPGHFAGHLSFEWGATVFTGDTVMGWSSSLISPPDGDAGAYRRSCMKLAKLGAARFLPGHGAAVATPGPRIGELLAHRASREAQIISAIETGHRTLNSITRSVYGELDANVLHVASRNTLAHLIDLWEQNRLAIQGQPTLGTLWHPA
ncbi:MAG: MBL fold metallo-hydrolase [Pseudomonadota bacterium]